MSNPQSPKSMQSLKVYSIQKLVRLILDLIVTRHQLIQEPLQLIMPAAIKAILVQAECKGVQVQGKLQLDVVSEHSMGTKIPQPFRPKVYFIHITRSIGNPNRTLGNRMTIQEFAAIIVFYIVVLLIIHWPVYFQIVI